MIDRRQLTSFDLWFVLVILLILGMGVLSIYSVTHDGGSKVSLPSYAKQMIWITAGWIAFFVFAFYDYHKMSRHSLFFYGGCIVLLILVMLSGHSGKGAQRWLSLGLFNLQPSEWIKLALVLVMAKYFSGRQRQHGLSLHEFLVSAVIVAVPAILVLKQPDLGTTLAILFVFAAMLFLAGLRSRRIGFSLLLFAMAFPFLWEIFWNSLKGYQQNRLSAFFNPNLDPMGQGYHALQSKIAIGSGQLLGKGLWGGTQSQLKFLPEGHTDFIFSVFAEEWGFIGVVVLLALYLFLIWWGIETAYKARDALGSLIAGGVVAMLLFYMIINIGMTVGVAPVVGVPLPLMSYGGNSIITNMAALGLLLNIRMRRFMLFH
jgi:rod shape determining protein RodA